MTMTFSIADKRKFIQLNFQCTKMSTDQLDLINGQINIFNKLNLV